MRNCWLVRAKLLEIWVESQAEAAEINKKVGLRQQRQKVLRIPEELKPMVTLQMEQTTMSTGGSNHCV